MRVLIAGASGFLGTHLSDAPAGARARGDRAREARADLGRRSPAGTRAPATSTPPPSPAPTSWSTWPASRSPATPTRRSTPRKCWTRASRPPRPRRGDRCSRAPAGLPRRQRHQLVRRPRRPARHRGLREPVATPSSPGSPGLGGRRPARRGEAGARVCVLRTAPVMDRTSAPLKQLRLLFQLGGGARLGSGEQHMPMISLRDWVGAVSYLIESRDVSGEFNLCCPETPTNAEFTHALASAVKRKAFLVAAGAGHEGRRRATWPPSCSARSTPARPPWSEPATTSRTWTCARCSPPRSPDRGPPRPATSAPDVRAPPCESTPGPSAAPRCCVPPTACPATTRSVTSSTRRRGPRCTTETSRPAPGW